MHPRTTSVLRPIFGGLAARNANIDTHGSDSESTLIASYLPSRFAADAKVNLPNGFNRTVLYHSDKTIHDSLQRRGPSSLSVSARAGYRPKGAKVFTVHASAMWQRHEIEGPIRRAHGSFRACSLLLEQPTFLSKPGAAEAYAVNFVGIARDVSPALQVFSAPSELSL